MSHASRCIVVNRKMPEMLPNARTVNYTSSFTLGCVTGVYATKMSRLNEQLLAVRILVA